MKSGIPRLLRGKAFLLGSAGLILLIFGLIYLGSETQDGPRDDPHGRTMILMMAVEAAFVGYSTDNGLPPSFENDKLVEAFHVNEPTQKSYFDSSMKWKYLNANREFIDGWGTPLRFVFKDKDDLLIESAGPDKIFGTVDDVTND